MNLLVLGASGGCGRWLVQLAAARGHRVTALVRSSAVLDPPATVRVVRGDPTDSETLDRLLTGQHAVASCVGIRRAGRSPWAPLRSPPDLVETVTRQLVTTMPRAGVQSVIAISAGGVADSRSQLSAPVRWLVSQGNVGVAYRDLAAMERVLGASTLDWVVVRPVTLVDGTPTGRAGPVPRYGMTSMVRRSDVASWMLDTLERPDRPSRQAVLLGTR